MISWCWFIISKRNTHIEFQNRVNIWRILQTAANICRPWEESREVTRSREKSHEKRTAFASPSHSSSGRGSPRSAKRPGRLWKQICTAVIRKLSVASNCGRDQQGSCIIHGQCFSNEIVSLNCWSYRLDRWVPGRKPLLISYTGPFVKACPRQKDVTGSSKSN